MIKYFVSLVALISVLVLVQSCTSQQDQGLKVVATAVPHAQLLESVKPGLKAKGVNLIIIVTDDYNMPNRALANGEIDANFFQHLPFLEEQIRQFHYPIHSIASIEIEPMGVYSRKVKKLSELKENATIAIPNDPTNEGRALLLLNDHGLIKLDNPHNLHATVLNIRENPKKIKFIEVDAAMLPRTLEDVDAAAINTNYALEAHLSPLKDALIIEGRDSPYANILVIRDGDDNRPDIKALKDAMTSDTMREYILKKYKGEIVPTF